MLRILLLLAILPLLASCGSSEAGSGAPVTTVETRSPDLSRAGQIDVRSFGAVGDGMADDTAAIQNAINQWALGVNSVLYFPPGNYRITTGLEYTFTSNDVLGRSISGDGATLVSGLGGGYMLTLTSRAVVRNISIKGLSFQGGSGEQGCIKLDGGSGAAAQFLYGLLLEHVNCDNFNGNGVHIVNNVFESSLIAVNSRSPLNQNGYPIYIEHGEYGNPSSLDLIGCNTTGGLIGVYVPSPANDIKVYGGTFILAREYGMKLENFQGGVVIGSHFENNWESAADLASGQAGLAVAGYGSVIGVYGTTNRKQKYVVRAYAFASDLTISGGAKLGDTAKFGYYQTDPTGSIIAIGGIAADYDAIGAVRITEIANGKVLASWGGEKRQFIPYSQTIVPSLWLGPYISVGKLTGDIFINAPAETPKDGDEIEFFFTQDSVGGRKITFSQAYSTNWAPSMEPLRSSVIRFRYEGGLWRQLYYTSGV